MQLNSTSSGRSSMPALAAVVVGCLASVAPAHADVLSTRRQPFEMFQSLGGTALLASRLREPRGIYVFADDVVSEKPIIRETTDQEHVIARIREWGFLPSNWDGEGASPPSALSLNAASDFVCLLPRSFSVPEPMLHATGRAGLAWSTSDGGYGELEFLNEGKVAYFFTNTAGKHKGVVTFDRQSIPAVVYALMPSANAA